MRSFLLILRNVAGHPLEDLCVSLLLYPSVAMQMEISTQPGKIAKNKKNDKELVNKGFSYSMESVPAIVINSKTAP